MLLRIYKVSSRLAKWKTVYGIFGMMGQYVLSGQSRIPLLDSVTKLHCLIKGCGSDYSEHTPLHVQPSYKQSYTVLLRDAALITQNILTHHTENSVNDLPLGQSGRHFVYP